MDVPTLVQEDTDMGNYIDDMDNCEGQHDVYFEQIKVATFIRRAMLPTLHC